MKVSKNLSVALVAVAAVFAGTTAGRADQAKEPLKWVMTCDNVSGCHYLSDGKAKNSPGGGPKEYPDQLKDDSIMVLADPPDGGPRADCTWKWVIIGGVPKWMCTNPDEIELKTLKMKSKAKK